MGLVSGSGSGPSPMTRLAEDKCPIRMDLEEREELACPNSQVSSWSMVRERRGQTRLDSSVIVPLHVHRPCLGSALSSCPGIGSPLLKGAGGAETAGSRGRSACGRALSVRRSPIHSTHKQHLGHSSTLDLLRRAPLSLPQ